MKEINLGTKYDGPQCCPPSPSEAQTSYPGTYLTLPEGTSIPPKGTITFRYRITGARTTDSMKKVAVDLELTDITDCSDGKDSGLPSAEQALAGYIAKLSGHESEDDD